MMSNFGIRQDSNSLFKGSIGHVKSRNACGLFLLPMGQLHNDIRL